MSGTQSEIRNPVWSRDELILALDLYQRHRSSLPGDTHPDVIELSRVLHRLNVAVSRTANATFRNPNGVAMKLQNFRRFDPTQAGRGLKAGGKGEEEVWTTFASDPGRLMATAEAIRRAVQADDGSEPSLVGPEIEEAEEGRVLTRLHQVRERNRAIVERRKAQALRDHGHLRCEACGFDFLARYGERGRGFIECHHTRPVHELRPGDKTRLEDLALLCANCHRMVHVSRPWLSVQDVARSWLSTE